MGSLTAYGQTLSFGPDRAAPNQGKISHFFQQLLNLETNTPTPQKNIPKSPWYFVESDSLMETIQNTHLSQLYISPALSHLQEMLMEKLPKG